ncbi:casein kinase I-like [Adelges cooleyi]|uniref:casein kinase I-like n=1 Tax=Adelges cooleyi TaxID=133065 RepID=UPI00217F9AB0|nr:casein kinase I-like [Adelges cooleyi]
MGRNLYTNEKVAIKLESLKTKSLQLIFENYFYHALGAKEGLPEVYYFGTIGLEYSALVMELLGPSLETLFQFCGKIFSLKTVLMIAIQIISRIEYIHSRNLVYRDIKPENFLVGLQEQLFPYRKATNNTIYIIDFGLANTYINPETKTHIPFSEQIGLIGTPRYMSANAHKQRQQSRRDDLESIGYMLLYFVKGELPWSELETTKEDIDAIGKIKTKISAEKLCKDLPEEFADYFRAVRKLEFMESPDYDALKFLFETVYELNRFPDDGLFDWSTTWIQ